MTYRSETGQFGEELAVKHLENKCFTIIERNFRRKWGEIDIIAKDKDRTLVFVEVKTVRSRPKVEDPRYSQAVSGQCGNAAIAESILPEEQLTKSKLRKLQRTAALYAGDHNNLVNENKGWRIDLIAITIFENGTNKINHYENL